MEKITDLDDAPKTFDNLTRTVAFFLDDKPVQICEVTAQFDGERWIIKGNCALAEQSSRRCKHTAAVIESFQANRGQFLRPVDITQVSYEHVEDVYNSDPAAYRDILLHFGNHTICEADPNLWMP